MYSYVNIYMQSVHTNVQEIEQYTEIKPVFEYLNKSDPYNIRKGLSHTKEDNFFASG